MKTEHKNLNRLIGAIAALIFLSGSFGCNLTKDDRRIITAPVSTDAPVYMPTSVHENVSLSDMVYERPAIEDMRAALDDLDRGLRNGKSPDELIATYEVLRRQYDHADSMLSLVYLLYAFDVTDSYYRDEYSYLKTALSELDGTMQSVSTELFQSSEEARQFAVESYGAGYLEAVDRDVLFEDETIQDLFNRDEQLSLAYDNRVAVFTLLDNGKRWSYSDIVSDVSLGYDEYYRLYDAYCAGLNEQVGPIFLEQLAVRTKIASMLGFASYPDYCYYNFGRDYTPADAKNLHAAVKTYIKPIFIEANERIDTYDLEVAYFDAEDFINALPGVASSFSPMLGEPVSYMISNRLYDATDSNTKMDTSFTTYISDYRAPFIFTRWTDSSDSIGTMLHELGHFISYYHNAEVGNSATDNLDLSEIDSQALALLLTEHYDQFYGKYAEEAVASVLMDAMFSLLSGCMEDEFQQEIYANPDMTLEEINALYLRLAKEYGMEEVYEYLGTEWVLVSHTFQAPMYYISYAASMVPALELYDLAQTDPGAAKTAYFNILMRDPYVGLDEVLEKNGLDPAFSEYTIRKIAEILKLHL